MIDVRNTAVAAVSGAALGLAQVAVAEPAGITTLGGDFGGGNDRVQGVQVTLVAWYCAMAVPLAVALAGARRSVSTKARMASVPAAAAGTLATWPLLAVVSGDPLRGDVVSAALAGIVLGVAAGVGTAAVPVIGAGLAAYAGLQWAAGLACTALLSRTVVYAGMVQLLGWDVLDEMRPDMPDLPNNLGYHLPGMLPVAIAVVVLTGVISGVAARRTRAWGPSAAAGAFGPVLAAVAYRLTPGQDYLWNEAAGTVVLWTALCSLPVAALTAALLRLGRQGPKAQNVQAGMSGTG
jgi:hypothetical protein